MSVAFGCAGTVDRPEAAAVEPIALDGWRRADHHGLILYTNAPEATTRLVFRQLNRFIDVVNRQINAHPFEANRRLEVFVFGSRNEYLRFAPDQIAGHAFRADYENITALSIEQLFEGTGTLYHELVHIVLYNEPGRSFPRWYHEGLAGFFGTSVLRGDVLTVGASPPDYLQSMRVNKSLSLRSLLSRVPAIKNTYRFYSDAWAFVHFGMLSETFGGLDRRNAFATFVSRVSLGELWEPAFVASFGVMPEEIDDEFARHRKKLTETRVGSLANIPLDLDQSEAVFVPMDRLEIARELANLGISGFDTGLDSAAELYDRLMEDSPSDPSPIYGRIRVAARRQELELGDALWHQLDENQRSGVEAWRAEADLCLAHLEKLDRDEHATSRAESLSRAVSSYSHIIAEEPNRLSALAGLGRALVFAENADPAPGIDALERANAMEPHFPELRLDLAELLIRSGATGPAGLHLDYVLETYPGTPFAKRAKKLQRKAR